MVNYIIFVVGVIVGLIVSTFISNKKSIGTILVDRSLEDNGDQYLLLQLNHDAKDILETKQLTNVRIQRMYDKRVK